MLLEAASFPFEWLSKCSLKLGQLSPALLSSTASSPPILPSLDQQADEGDDQDSS